jgi:hypothetical protein
MTTNTLPVQVPPAVARAIERIHRYVCPDPGELQEAWDDIRAALMLSISSVQPATSDVATALAAVWDADLDAAFEEM